MKTLNRFFISIVILLCILFGTLFFMDKYYTGKIQGRYYDSINSQLIFQKNKGLELQRESLKRDNVINIYGSSELGTKSIEYHPSNFFKENNRGLDTNLIGIGYCQSIIHAINFAALGEDMKDKKVAIIVSPQWFTKEGLIPEQFNMNFSDFQLYTLLNSPTLSSSTKDYIAKRVSDLTKKDSNYPNAHFYSYLYSKNNFFSKSALAITMPYYKFYDYILSVRDKAKTYQILEKYKDYDNKKGSIKNVDWVKEENKADEIGKAKANNNQFYLMNDYYDSYIKGKEDNFKGYLKGKYYSESPEYEDLKVLLDICKQYNVKPLFINVPVNGKWYDFGEFPKEERDIYYNKVKGLISSYGYKIADFSSCEYEPYFLQDIMHLGWKGWLNVDKAIDEYYNKN